MNLNELISETIARHQSGGANYTLLAVCPNSMAVLEAAIQAGVECNSPLLFAATLNQVDRDGGYTTWTPAYFVEQIHSIAGRYGRSGQLFPCLDHGGPWLKDLHTIQNLPLDSAMREVKASITACLEAGYELLHIDPTVDRTLPPGETPPVELVVARTVELIAHAESERKRLNLAPLVYEVGTEEVHGGLVDFRRLEQYLKLLKMAIAEAGMTEARPGFVVAQLGTDLHTTHFDSAVAARIYELVMPLGLLIKGHYTDWVSNPADYPRTGIGAANIGPEFTAVECDALVELEQIETARSRNRSQSNFYRILSNSVQKSGRWKKWLLPEEQGVPFEALDSDRQAWLVRTGARYIWTDPEVLSGRDLLYENVKSYLDSPHGYVVNRIAGRIKQYIKLFNLENLLG